MTKAFGASATDRPLEAMVIERRRPGPHDVQIEIAYCGVCHSDLHTVQSEWAGTLYPCVPGHEIVGHVSALGDHVTKFKVGDIVGVGCLVDSCQRCIACDNGLEQYCDHGFTGTYNFPTPDAPGHTLGGYSQRIVVNDKFVLKIRHPEEQLAAVAPLLCAGITTYSPLRHWKVGPGKKVGIVGIGGLGHMGVKLAHAMGAHTVAFTTSESKRQDALDLSFRPVRAGQRRGVRRHKAPESTGARRLDDHGECRQRRPGGLPQGPGGRARTRRCQQPRYGHAPPRPARRGLGRDKAER